jgi:hypothetical protein
MPAFGHSSEAKKDQRPVFTDGAIDEQGYNCSWLRHKYVSPFF